MHSVAARDIHAPLHFFDLTVEDHQQPCAGGIVPEADLGLLHSGSCGPVDVPDRISRHIRPDTPNQKRILQQHPAIGQLTQPL